MINNHWPAFLVCLAFTCLWMGCDDAPNTGGELSDIGTMIEDGGMPDGHTPDQGVQPDIQWPEEAPLDGDPDLEGAQELEMPVSEGSARAGRVDTEAERLTGPEARCRVGDYRLDNAQISVCIQSGFSSGQITGWAGQIVDAHRADRPGTDMLDALIHAPGLGEVTLDEMGIVRDGSEGGMAVIRIAGHALGMRAIQGVLPGSFLPPPVRAMTEFRLSPDASEVEILTWIIGTEEGRGFISMYDLVQFGDQTRLFKPALPNSIGPFDFVAAEAPQVSYSWTAESGPFTLFALIADEIPGAPVVYESETIEPGQAILHRRFFGIGTGDVESLRTGTDELAPFVIRAAPGTRIDVMDSAGAEVTRLLIDDAGEGQVRLVPGDYAATTYGYAGGDIAFDFTVGAENEPLVLEQVEPARLEVQVQDAQGRGLAARLDIAGTQSGRFFVIEDNAFELPPGEYALTITRGWHFTVGQATVTLEAGQTASLSFELEEVIPIPGWTSGEFHQHASPSLDSTVAVEDRVLSNAVEGVGFMQPSDHNIIFDYAEVIERLGLSDRITAPMNGIEISPVITHIGAYGMPYDPQLPAGGAPTLANEEDGFWRGLTVPELVILAREMGAELIQMNHPRQSTSGYFTHSGYGSLNDVTRLDPETWTSDFDALEVYNNQGSMCSIFADWMGLLNQGLRVTGVGNSDTHSIGSPPGYPRNYIPTMANTLHGVAAEEVVGAVRGGQLIVGGGAVMDFPDGPLPGAEIMAEGESTTVRVRLRTPPYAQLTQLLVLFNGIIIETIELDSAVEDIVDFDEAIEVATPVDGHLIFLAVGDGNLEHIRPGRAVFAFSNPIWIDVDGGGITPVGLGEVSIPQLSFCN